MCEVVMYILKEVKPPIQCSHIALNDYSPILKSKVMIFSFLLTSIIYPTLAVILTSVKFLQRSSHVLLHSDLFRM